MEQTKVLLVDDDTDLGNLISMVLKADGYIVHYQNSLAGIEGIIQEFKPSIVVLDVEVGEDDGIEKAKEIIQTHPSLPILFISSHTDMDSVRRGIGSGGVHYFRKPFDMQELKIYIDRFTHPEREKATFAEIGDYSLNLNTRELFYKHNLVKQLSALEYHMLRLLLQNKNEVVSNETLSEKIWNKKYPETEASINNLVSKLRKLFEVDQDVEIQNVKGIGYRLNIQESN
jgi:DNA-binding response OmpR family regulator